MSFFHEKMSQNFWATIMPFGPVTLISSTAGACIAHLGIITTLVKKITNVAPVIADPL